MEKKQLSQDPLGSLFMQEEGEASGLPNYGLKKRKTTIESAGITGKYGGPIRE